MKKFVAIYIGSPTSRAASKWDSMDEATRNKQVQAGMMAWKKWAETNAKSIVEGGAPLGKTKQISSEGVTDIKNQMTAYTVVQAESHEAAAKLFLNHPHFTIFPGDSVEVMECLPMPGT